MLYWIININIDANDTDGNIVIDNVHDDNMLSMYVEEFIVVGVFFDMLDIVTAHLHLPHLSCKNTKTIGCRPYLNSSQLISYQ